MKRRQQAARDLGVPLSRAKADKKSKKKKKKKAKKNKKHNKKGGGRDPSSSSSSSESSSSSSSSSTEEECESIEAGSRLDCTLWRILFVTTRDETGMSTF